MMTHPRSAFGASPSRGRRLRTGKAGSAAAAWLLLAACASGPPPADWQLNAQSASEAATAAYLAGDSAAETRHFERARSEVSRTGSPQRMARIELLRCAAHVASLVFEACPGYERLQADADAPERAYAQYLAGRMKGLLRRISRRILPVPARRWLWARWHGGAYCPPVGWVRLGSLRRVMPISRKWGFDRGLPIDRYYIERFLSAHAADIRGRVLEIQDNTYTRKFGGDRVTRSDVLHAVEGNPKATIVADLTCADHLPSRTFDCVILTQTLQFIYDVHAALKTLYRILKPRGVLFVTCPGISQISRNDFDRWGDYWRFTALSAQRMLETVFPAANVRVEAYGNVLAATAFLQGLAAQELRPTELDYSDPDYQVLITVRAVKPDVPPFL